VHPVLESTDLRKGYPSPRGRVEVLRGVDLRVERAEVVAVLGPSGSGKSTLLHLMAGLDGFDGGEVRWAGVRVDPASPGLAARRAAHVGLVFQHHYLLSELDVIENVTLPGRIAGRRVDEEGLDLLAAMGLADRARSTIHALSGGERQRVAVARALVLGPSVVLADEPTGSLDRASAHAVYQVLRNAASARGAAVVIVTHDEALVADADRHVRLDEGRLAAAEPSVALGA
jgi:lipoprotein-releasing system ATP-binding protein